MRRQRKKHCGSCKASKVAEKKKADHIRKEDLMPGIKKDIDKGIEHVIKLSNTRLKEILFFTLVGEVVG